MTSLTPALDAAGGRTRTRLALDAATLDRFAPWAIALVVIAALWLVHQDFPVGVAQDDGLYVILAKAVATGRGFRFINLPDAPVGAHYPPGYPLLLAALWHLASSLDARLYLFALVNIGLLGAVAAGTYFLARRAGLTTRWATVCALAGLLMPPAMWMATALLSEPLWLALAIPWLLYAESAVDDRADRPATWVGLGLAAGVIALVRTQSITLEFGLLAVLVVHRRWKAAAMMLAGAAVFILPWQLWVAHFGHLPPELAAKYGPYGPWLAEGFHTMGVGLLTATVARNVFAVGQILGSMFGPVTATWIGVILIAPPMVAGALRLARRAPVTLAMTLAHGAIILAWPFDPRRFVWTSWPFVILLIAAGLAELRTSVAAASRLLRVVVRADAVLVIAGGVMATVIMDWSGAYRTIAVDRAHQITATVDWVRWHAKPGAVVATEDETAVFLYTGHLAVPAMTFSAASYARSEGLSASVLPGILQRYRPDLSVVFIRTALEAAQGLAAGPRPVLRPIALAGKAVVFQRIP